MSAKSMKKVQILSEKVVFETSLRVLETICILKNMTAR